MTNQWSLFLTAGNSTGEDVAGKDLSVACGDVEKNLR
jgi:hypothetical protein